jgi:hypothetical protein
MVTELTRISVFVVLVMVGGIWWEVRRIRRRLDAEADALHILAQDAPHPDR